MIEKRAEYIRGDYDSEVFSFVDPSNGDSLVKTASYDGPVAEYLNSLKKEEGFLYALVNALTAGEYYGPNRNGDFFPEEALKKYHNTFVEHGHVYKHHINKDPEKAMGKVIFSHYNPTMKRVEVVIRLKKDHPDVQKIEQNLAQGQLPKVSMGCKVPYDVCSITGKKARTRSEYSSYLLNMMNKILDDGRRVYAINTRPRFFDLSIVTIPADPVASFMVPLLGDNYNLHKAASIEKSTDLNAHTFEKAASAEGLDKSSQISKNIEGGGSIDAIQEDPKGLIKETTERFTQEEIEKLSEYPLNEVLSTFAATRILPHPEDFQKLALYHMGKKELADELEKRGEFFEITKETRSIIPDDININNVKEKIASVYISNISNYSLTKPFIINRILEKTSSLKDIANPIFPNRDEVEKSFIKKLLFDEEPQPARSGVENPIVPFVALGTLYAGYARYFGSTANPSDFMKLVGKHP